MSVSMIKKVPFLLIPLIVAGAVSLHFKRIHQLDEIAVAEQSAWAVHVATVGHGAVHDAFPALGKVVSATDLHISPQISGTVLAMGPRAGGAVKKGDLILHLDTRELEANLSALKAELVSAQATERNDRRELERERKLMKSGGSSISAVEQRETRLSGDAAKVHALKDQIQALKVKVSYGHIYAETDAVVAQRLAEPGDTVFPGKPVYVLSASDGGRVVVPVPLSTVTRIKPGGIVRLSMGKRQMTTRITRVNPALDALSMGSLEIDLPARPFGLPDGARIPAWVIQSSIAHTLIVPADALIPSRDATHRAVFKVDHSNGATLARVPVTVKLCGEEGCAVSGALKAGDQVVKAHESVLLKLQDKEPVSIISEPAEGQS